LYEGSSPHAILYLRAQAPASRFFFGTDFNNSTATEAANQRARKSIRAAHVQYDQIFRRFLIHSVFSATPLLSITALFREPKAREDHPTLIPISWAQNGLEIYLDPTRWGLIGRNKADLVRCARHCIQRHTPALMRMHPDFHPSCFCSGCTNSARRFDLLLHVFGKTINKCCQSRRLPDADTTIAMFSQRSQNSGQKEHAAQNEERKR
jgi:hypothetical protein